MHEKTFLVTAMVVKRIYCEKCKDENGTSNIEMKYSGPAMMLQKGDPQRYGYFCPKCRSREILDKSYPLQMMQFREINENGFVDEKKDDCEPQKQVN
jgi:hypothetical protein